MNWLLNDNQIVAHNGLAQWNALIKDGKYVEFFDLLNRTPSDLENLKYFIALMMRYNKLNLIKLCLEYYYRLIEKYKIDLIIFAIHCQNKEIILLLFSFFDIPLNNIKIIDESIKMKNTDITKLLIDMNFSLCNLDYHCIFTACTINDADHITLLLQLVDDYNIIEKSATNVYKSVCFEKLVNKCPSILESKKIFKNHLRKGNSEIIKYFYKCGYFYNFGTKYYVSMWPKLLKVVIGYNQHENIVNNIEDNILFCMKISNFDSFSILNSLSNGPYISDSILKMAINIYYEKNCYSHYKSIDFIGYYIKNGIHLHSMCDYIIDYAEKKHIETIKKLKVKYLIIENDFSLNHLIDTDPLLEYIEKSKNNLLIQCNR